MQPPRRSASSIVRLIAFGFFVSAGCVGLFTAWYFSRDREGGRLFHESSANSGEGGDEEALGSQIYGALGSGSVLWNRVPSRVVRRTFVDVESGTEVSEESAYFDVGEGEGENLVSALQEEGALNDILLVRKHKVELQEGKVLEKGRLAAPLGKKDVSGLRGVASGLKLPAPAPRFIETPASTASWKPLEIPTRPADWVAPQYVIPGERESSKPEHPSLAVSKIASL